MHAASVRSNGGQSRREREQDHLPIEVHVRRKIVLIGDYSMSFSELSEELEQTVGEEELLNAFSGIEIFRIVGKKKKRWFSEETA